MANRYAVSLGLMLITASLPVWAQSPAEQRSLDAAGQVDVSQFFSSKTDARSRTFPFRGDQTHTFTVKQAGRYQLVSDTVGGDSDYRINATLSDADGNAVSEERGLGRSGGLDMTVELTPGEYTLTTNARKMGSAKSGANGYRILVAGLDASGQRMAQSESSIDDGDDSILGQPGESGSVFVRPGAAVGVIGAEQSSQSNDDDRAESEPEATSSSQETTADDQLDTIVADVRVAFEGEAVSFSLDNTREVAIQSSSFPGNEGSYRLKARLLDDQGNVVAEDEGSAFEGNFAINEQLPAGDYTVWVDGRRIGSIQGRDSTYELRVEVLP